MDSNTRVIQKKSLIPFAIFAALASAYVSPLEARGQFSIPGAAIKIFPILYLIVYLNSFLDSAFHQYFNTTKKDKRIKADGLRWREQRHLATGVIGGLMCSVVGDVILLLREKEELYFVAGTGAFGLAQLCYIHAMGFHRPVNFKTGAVVFLVASVPSYFFLPRINNSLVLAVVLGYGVLLATSLWRSIDRVKYEDGRSRTKKLLLPFGFSMFLLSDAWIGMSMFLLRSDPITSARFILLTYYLAQGIIAASAS